MICSGEELAMSTPNEKCGREKHLGSVDTKNERKSKLSLLSLAQKETWLVREVGINISRSNLMLAEGSKSLVLDSGVFFPSGSCPDNKKTATDPNTGDVVQLWYHMGSLRCLHQQFM